MIWNGPMGVFEYEAFAKVHTHQKLPALFSPCFLSKFLFLLEGQEAA